MPTVDPLNLDQLRIFLTVCEVTVLKEAAAQLGMTPSAVSQSLAKLEESIGVSLFVHNVRPLRLTAAGRQLAKEGRPLLMAAQGLKQRLSNTQLSEMSLTVGFGETAAATIAPWVTARLYERVRELVTISSFTGALMEGLSQDKLTVAVVAELPKQNERWLSVPLYDEGFVLVSARNVPEVKNKAALSALAAERPFICYAQGSSDLAIMERLLTSYGISPVRRISVGSSYQLMGVMAELGGWSFLPPSNCWCGRFFGDAVQFSELPFSHRMIRRMWAVGDRLLFANEVQLVADIVQRGFVEKLLPALGGLSPVLAKHAWLCSKS